MNKAELIASISERSDITKAQSTVCLNAFIDSVTTSLSESNNVSLVGFGCFEVKARAARAGRNPQTGEEIEIKAANVPAFKAGKALKEAVNKK